MAAVINSDQEWRLLSWSVEFSRVPFSSPYVLKDVNLKLKNTFPSLKICYLLSKTSRRCLPPLITVAVCVAQTSLPHNLPSVLTEWFGKDRKNQIFGNL